MSEFENLEILGVGRRRGGRFGKVLIAGAGKIEGDVECDELSIPGSGKIEEGCVLVHGPLSCYGSGSVEGAVQADKLAVFGAFCADGGCLVNGDAEVAGRLEIEGPCEIRGKVGVSGSMSVEGPCTLGPQTQINGTMTGEGDIRAGSLRVAGSLTAEAALRAENIEIDGRLSAESGVQAETFRARGKVEIDGELNADLVELELTGSDEIESIVGGCVKVKKADSAVFRGGLSFNFFFDFGKNCKSYFSKGTPRLHTELIEADEIELEYTDCETVRGVNVHIGPECVIDRVEFSGALTTAADAVIAEKVKI